MSEFHLVGIYKYLYLSQNMFGAPLTQVKLPKVVFATFKTPVTKWYPYSPIMALIDIYAY